MRSLKSLRGLSRGSLKWLETSQRGSLKWLETSLHAGILAYLHFSTPHLLITNVLVALQTSLLITDLQSMPP